jgi:hypothetical protein
MEKHSLVRTIYLYLFTVVGLALLTIGAVRFADMGLKAFVFTKAEEPERVSQEYNYYSLSPILPERIEEYQENQELTDQEKAAVKEWYQDYKRWKEAQSKVNYLASRRHEDASLNLSFILIGLPLYLYHWGIIRRETQRPEKAEISH